MFNLFKKKQEEDAIRKSSKAAYDLVTSDAWGDVQRMFLDKISEIQSIMNVDNSSSDKAFLDMKVRVNLAIELKDILNSIIGSANRYEFNYKEQKAEDNSELEVVER
jgi:hypothetical protein